MPVLKSISFNTRSSIKEDICSLVSHNVKHWRQQLKLGGEGCYSTGVLFQFKNPRPGHNTQKKNHFYLAKQNLWEGNICQWLSFDKRTSSTVGWVVGGGRLTADVSRGCTLSLRHYHVEIGIRGEHKQLTCLNSQWLMSKRF